MQEVSQPDRTDPEIFRPAPGRVSALWRRAGAAAVGSGGAVQGFGMVRHRLREEVVEGWLFGQQWLGSVFVGEQVGKFEQHQLQFHREERIGLRPVGRQEVTIPLALWDASQARVISVAQACAVEGYKATDL